MGRCSDARDRLLSTASSLLHERGYTAVSVSDICKASGLKKGSFYHFFQSKHALVLATLDRFADHQRRAMTSPVDRTRPVRDQLVGRFVSMYQTYLLAQQTYGCAHGCPVGNLAQEMAHRDAQMRDKLSGIFAEWQAGLARLLRLANEREEMAVSDPDRAAEALLAYLQGTLLLAKTNNDPAVFLRLAHGLVALAQADLQTVPAPAPEQCAPPRQTQEVLS